MSDFERKRKTVILWALSLVALCAHIILKLGGPKLNALEVQTPHK